MPIMQSMQTYSDYENRQRALVEQLKKQDLESISCSKCGSKFFEQIEICKYKSNHSLVLGQDIPTKPGAQPYKFLRCIRCSSLLEPRLLLADRDMLREDYNELLDTLEGKNDTREKGAVERVNSAIPSEEL